MSATLETRLKRHVSDCLKRKTFKKDGKDRNNQRRHYCTLFHLTGIKDPYECPYKTEPIEIKKGDRFVHYYGCRR